MTVAPTEPLEVQVSVAANPIAYGTIAYAQSLAKSSNKSFKLSWNAQGASGARIIVPGQVDITHGTSVLRYLYIAFDHATHKASVQTMIHYFLDTADRLAEAADFTNLTGILTALDGVLAERSFVADTVSWTVADIALWGALRGSGPFQGIVKKTQGGSKSTKGSKGKGDKAAKGSGKQDVPPKSNDGPTFINLMRWYNTTSELPEAIEAQAQVRAHQQNSNKAKKDQGSFEVGLPGAKKGAVVTRFPPEPSGYLHIGHIKAALLNSYFAEIYEGTLLLRFDDTNPSKEKADFERAIIHDLELLHIRPNKVSHTSDHFAKMLELADHLLEKGLAYADDTDQETMRKQRMDGEPSKCRDQSVKRNMDLWKAMKEGSASGVKYCLRAKMSVDAKNKALRDPVIYRCNVTDSHHQTGRKYNVYPTYDFACPIVDSVEGVTHALRTNEYRDREPQYQWFIKNLDLRPVSIWEYSRMNFVYTLLSKRKLQWFVDQGRVSGWDDPRFPTVRGILRRGMTVEALKQYILMQGASQSTLLLEWDKLWAINKKVLDPIAPRHTALDSGQGKLVSVVIQDGPSEITTKEVLVHKKNESLGKKTTGYYKEILLAYEDVQDSFEGEEVTLMDWGNLIITSVEKDGDRVSSLNAKLHLEGDVKTTKKKLTWLVRAPEDKKDVFLTNVVLHDFDYLITKKKLEDGDDLNDCLTPVTMFETNAIGDAGLQKLARGTHIQLERRGYYIVERPYSTGSSDPMILNSIPDGKAASVASKHQEATPQKASTKGKGKSGNGANSNTISNGTYPARAEMLQSVRDHTAKLGMYDGGSKDIVPKEVNTGKLSMFRTEPVL